MCCAASELGFSFCPQIAPKQLWDCVHVQVACLTSIARCFLRNKLISCDCRRVNRAGRNETRCSKKKRVPICGNSILWVQVNLNYRKEFPTSWLVLLKVSFFSVQKLLAPAILIISRTKTIQLLFSEGYKSLIAILPESAVCKSENLI